MGVSRPPYGRPPTHLIFAYYDERLSRLNRSAGHRQNFRIVAHHFESYLASREMNPTDAEPWVVEEFLVESGIAATTRRVWHSYIHSAYRYAQRRRLIDRIPTDEVEFEKVPDKEPTVLSGAELREIRDACTKPRHWQLFRLLAYTGMRRAEIAGLTWADIDFARNTIRVMGKGGKLRLVPIHPALSEVLIAAPPVPGQAVLPGPRGRTLSVKAIHDALREMSPTACLHDFRRTVASSLYANGVRADTIDRILGWAPREVRSRYYVKIADEELQGAILQLHLNDPISS